MFLSAWKQFQSEYLLWLGTPQKSVTPIVTNEVGTYQDPDRLSSWYRDFCVRYGFGIYTNENNTGYKGITFHNLRHTQASLLIAGGRDIKTVQGRLGHQLASTTLNIYAAFIPGRDAEAAAFIGNLLSAKPKPMGQVINF